MKRHISKILNNANHDQKGRNLLSESIQIEEELLPGFVKPTIWIIALILISFVVWASITPIKEISKGMGDIIPTGKVQVVQHPEGGIVKQILVKENQEVSQNTSLILMDGRQNFADLNQLKTQLTTIQLQEAGLQAFINQTDTELLGIVGPEYEDLRKVQYNNLKQKNSARESAISVLDEQISQKRKRIDQVMQSLSAAQKDVEITTELLKMREELADEMLINRATLLETRRSYETASSEFEKQKEELVLAQHELQEFRNKKQDTLNQLEKEAIQELSNLKTSQQEAIKFLEKTQAIVSHLDIKSPAQGLVQDLKIHTIGQVIQPGETLMKIVPNDSKLEAEVKVDPKDIGFIQEGQPVKIRISSYDYSRYGYASGKLLRISAYRIIDDKDPKQEAYFKVWISLDKSYIGDDPKKYPIQPGMSVEAEIITGEKKLITYILKPIADLFNKSFGER